MMMMMNSQLYIPTFTCFRQFHCKKHLQIKTFIATFWKSSCEIRNFRPQISQKRPAKSWGDCIVKWWAHVMGLGKYPAFSQVIRGALSIFHGPLVESSFSLMGDVIDTKISNR